MNAAAVPCPVCGSRAHIRCGLPPGTGRFQRRHYEALAAVMRQAVAETADYGPEAADALETVIARLADALAADSDRFNRARFLAAVGPIPP